MKTTRSRAANQALLLLLTLAVFSIISIQILSTHVVRSIQAEPFLFEMRESLEQTFTRKTIDGGDGISACLIIMDDNHFLIEWLAYHYYYLPLRRLIVAVDPKARTSPKPILDRYHSRGLINITVWDNDHFFPLDVKEKHKHNQPKLHLVRQEYFILGCLKAFKEENRTWITTVDADEFIVPNKYANPVYNFTNRQKVYSLLTEPPNEHWKNVTKNSSTACHPMIRLTVGTKESSDEVVQQGIPDRFFNGSNFLTYRFGWPQPVHGNRKPAKTFLDLSRVPSADLYPNNTNPHRPVQNHCLYLNAFPTVDLSPFSVYHYTGTFEQFRYRADGRPKTRELYNQRYFDVTYEDSAKFWLKGFIMEVGLPMAKILLEGVGELEKIDDNVSLIRTEYKNDVNWDVGQQSKSVALEML